MRVFSSSVEETVFTIFRVKSMEDSEIREDPISEVRTKDYNSTFQIAYSTKKEKVRKAEGVHGVRISEATK